MEKTGQWVFRIELIKILKISTILRGTTSLTAWKNVIFVNLKKKVSHRMF